MKYFEDDIVKDKEIQELVPYSECTNNILTLLIKVLTVLSCEHIFHRTCIRKQLLYSLIKPATCSFPNCEKTVNIVLNPNPTRRGSQSSQSSRTSALSNLMDEKINIILPVILEDPMEGVEKALIQETEIPS